MQLNTFYQLCTGAENTKGLYYVACIDFMDKNMNIFFLKEENKNKMKKF